MTDVAIIIPFRDRGFDPHRALNLARVTMQWETYPHPLLIVNDGRDGNAQFNRSAAYNRGMALAAGADVFVFAESDMLIDRAQVESAIEIAQITNSLVVPFTRYAYMDKVASAHLRAGQENPARQVPERVIDDGVSIGAINVVSAAAMEKVGRWDENFEGSWYDDNAMAYAFALTAGPLTWVPGTAYHLYHLPGWTGAHLSAEDKVATQRNKRRYQRYRQATTAEQIRTLTLEGA